MEVMLWIRAPGARAQGQGSVQPLHWSRGQSLRKSRTPLPPPRPQQGPSRLAMSQGTALHTTLPNSGLAGAAGPGGVTALSPRLSSLRASLSAHRPPPRESHEVAGTGEIPGHGRGHPPGPAAAQPPRPHQWPRGRCSPSCGSRTRPWSCSTCCRPGSRSSGCRVPSAPRRSGRTGSRT